MARFMCSLFSLGIVAIVANGASVARQPVVRKQSATIGSQASVFPANVLVTNFADEASWDKDVRRNLVKMLSLVKESALSSCMKDRVLNASRVHSTSDDAWEVNLAPAIRDSFKYQQQYQGSGIAVLVSGQVRTGIRPDVIESMRVHVFDVLKRRSPQETVQVFAFLAFTSGGFHPWQHVGHLSQDNDIDRSQVEQMLQGYGVNFTLEQFTGSNRFPDFKAEGCCKENHEDQNCGSDDEMSEQWLKVHGAIEMMKEEEQSRGQQYSHVVRLRPDIILWKDLHLEPPWQHNVPVTCAGGGGGSDALLTMPRWAVDAMDGMWRMTKDCPMPGVDECRSRELVSYCTSKVQGAGAELCGHLLWLGLWRHGIPVAGCDQGLTLVRP